MNQALKKQVIQVQSFFAKPQKTVALFLMTTIIKGISSKNHSEPLN